jgi:hypothetical protein
MGPKIIAGLPLAQSWGVPKMANAKKKAAKKKGSASKQGVASETAVRFMSLVHQFRYQQGPSPQPRDLTNFTFWTGAGFSKSWDPAAPVGTQLFTPGTEMVGQVAGTLALQRMFGLDLFDQITPGQFRQIVYQLDMYDRYPEVRSRYTDEQNLRLFRAALRAAIVERYDTITSVNYFDERAKKFPLSNPTTNQRNIIRFFCYLQHQINGSEPLVEGIRTHFVTTNYDYVIETILDNVIGPDDSMFLYTYRGFTPTKIVNECDITPVHEHWLVGHLLKINGGFEILRRGDGLCAGLSAQRG